MHWIGNGSKEEGDASQSGGKAICNCQISKLYSISENPMK
jgi:hypothetical protein